MEPKRVFRSRKDRVIGGVCGGLGKYFSVDPVLVRVIWAVLFFAAGMGLLGYILAWIIIPEDPSGE
jgi:phage shock protein C